MFSSITVGDILGVSVIALFGAYVHYRVTTRMRQTRLAVGLLEDDDSVLVSELENLISKGDIKPLSGAYTVEPAVHQPQARKSTRSRKPKRRNAGTKRISAEVKRHLTHFEEVEEAAQRLVKNSENDPILTEGAL